MRLRTRAATKELWPVGGGVGGGGEEEEEELEEEEEVGIVKH